MLLSKELLIQLLQIPSPTYQEKEKCDFIESWVNKQLPSFNQKRIGNNLIASAGDLDNTHLAFVGHMDTVPKFFKPYEKDSNIHGSGASDMQAGLASMLCFIKNNESLLLEKYRVSVIIYDKEEGTPIHENGLNEVIQNDAAFIKSIECAIVGEPTDNNIQLGCVGSIHFKLNVFGEAAHSARPWHGKNALYEALPIINKIAAIEPKKQSIFGVDFFDVISITESQSSPGRTTIPDHWVANINYRFSPTHSMDAAMDYVKNILDECQVPHELTCLNAVNAGAVIMTPILEKLKQSFEFQAKQAWTDVAQLTELGVSAFNFGPGRQDQAHQVNEYVNENDMLKYEALLYESLLEEK